MADLGNILDPNIPFRANTLADYTSQNQTTQQNQNVLAQQRLALKAQQDQMRQQQILRSVLADQSNKDPKTGLISDEAIGKVMAVDPDLAVKISNMRSQQLERKAQAAHLDSETAALNEKRTLGVLSVGAAILDDPEITPAERQEKARNAMIEAIDLESVGQAEKDQIKARVAKMTPEQIRAGVSILKTRAAPKKSGDVETITDSHNVTFDHDKLTGENTFVSGPPGTGEPGKPYEPAGKISKIGTLTVGRSPATIATAKFIEENPGATSDEIAKFNAQFKTTETAGTAPVKADAQSLANITKISDASEAFENTAMANFNTAMKFYDDPEKRKSLKQMGPWLNKWVDEGEAMLGDPTIPAYVASILTGANEYAKVMAGSTGSQGSTVDSRKEARDLFSPYLNEGQIKPVVEIARRDMENKKSSYKAEIESIKARIGGDNASGGAEKPKPKGGGYNTAADVAAAFHDGKLTKDAATKILRDNGWAR
jgi:hypothetical protein